MFAEGPPTPYPPPPLPTPVYWNHRFRGNFLQSNQRKRVIGKILIA
jgi:hypothetical protein